VRDIPAPLRRLLKQVSRSFFLSIAVLPGSLRRPIGVAYLLARAADTVADTRIVTRPDRLRILDGLRQALDAPAGSSAPDLTGALTGSQSPAERAVLLRLDEVFAAFAELLPGDRRGVRDVVQRLIQGMQTDLTTFPGETEAELAALEARADLDRYTYFAAGCVGEFWTEMTMAHRPACRAWDGDLRGRQGKRFGQALQMTNVLRDLAQDLRIGRCYVPRQELLAHGLRPADLLHPGSLERFRPLLADLLRLTLTYYAEAWDYIAALPGTEVRMRLACLLPVFIGLATLDRIACARGLLDPAVHVKIPRSTVRGILLRSVAALGNGSALAGYHRGLRAAVERALGP